MINLNFLDIVKNRFASKKFNGEKVSEEKFDELVEMIRMSASSFGLQPYQINIVKDSSVKETLKPLAFGQDQVTSCSHLLVFSATNKIKERIDRYAEMISDENGELSEGAKGYIDMMRNMLESKSDSDRTEWAARQTYIAVGNALNGAKAIGYDSSPMEGFDPAGFKKELGLSDDLTPVVIVAVGIAADEMGTKIRYPKEELFF